MNPAPASPSKSVRLASDVARLSKLSQPALLLLTPALTPRQYFELLASKLLVDDAIRFLAAALPKRESVGWAVLCVKESVPLPLTPVAAKALAATETWVREPSDQNRQAAGAAAESAGYGSPTGLLAAAAFWSGGSLSPPHLPPVPPREDLTGIAVSGAIQLACAESQLGLDPAKLKCLALGGEIASAKVKVN